MEPGTNGGAASAVLNGAADPAVRPFRIAVPTAELDDLHDRIRRTRWPSSWSDDSWTRGVPVDYLRHLTSYWLHHYDWRRAESELNELPQLLVTIDDQPIHVMYVRSPVPNAIPLVLTRGWPSSGVEFLRLIGPLTDPARTGSTRTRPSTSSSRRCPGTASPVRSAGRAGAICSASLRPGTS
jgi:epoxide hydrolase